MITIIILQLISCDLVFTYELTALNPSGSGDDKCKLYLGICVILFLCCIIHFICVRVKYLNQIFVAYDIFLLTLGILAGVLMHHVKEVRPYLYYDITTEQMCYLYMTILVFWLTYNIDVHGFFKSLSQIFIIGFPIYFLTSFLTGFIMTWVINPRWDWDTLSLFGLATTPIFPLHFVRQLKEYGSGARQTIVLLEGEAIMTYTIFQNLFYLRYIQRLQVVRHWYQYVSILIRFVGLGSLGGFCIGMLGGFLMQAINDDIISVFTIIFAIPFIAFFVGHDLMTASGNFAVLFTGIMMNKKRSYLSPEVDEVVTKYWDILFHTINSLFLFYLGAFGALEGLQNYFSIKLLNYGFITYLIELICRFISFTIFSPVLSRLGFGINFSNIVICVWGDLKSPIATFITMLFVTSNLVKGVTLILFSYLCMSILINGTLAKPLLKFLGLAEISRTKQINMNSCMRLLMSQRDVEIAKLKMDPYMGEVNWDVFLEGTKLRHPYENELDDEEDEVVTGFRFSYCSDCNIEVINEPTKRELKEMAMDAKLRILKAKKISYARQCEEGALSIQGLRLLTHAIEIAIDTEEVSIALDELFKLFKKESFITRNVRKSIDELFDHELSSRKSRSSQKKIRNKRAYQIHESALFIISVNAILILNTIQTVYEVYFWEKENYELHEYFFTTTSTLFQMIYLMEFIVKVSAFAWVYAFSHGLRTYFTSSWNVLEFTFLIVGFIDLIINYVFTYFNQLEQLFHLFLFLRLFRAIRLLILIRYCAFISPALARYVDSKSNYHIAVAYELGKAYVRGEEDVLEMLPNIIEHEKIREEVKARIEEDHLAIVKILNIVQKDKPWVAITVKTAQAIRMVLNSIRDSIKELKMSGWVDEGEYLSLMNCLRAKNKYVSLNLNFVQPNSPEILFKSVEWMAHVEEVVNCLFDGAVKKKFSAGEVICEEGKPSDGVYVLVSGLLKQAYRPNHEVLENLRNYGCLPVVDYVSSTSGFYKPFFEYIVSGNSIGELSAITGRPYNCTITAETRSKLYFINAKVLHEALNKYSQDFIQGITARIWRFLSINIVFPILLSKTSEKQLNIENIKLALEDSIVPDLSKCKYLEIDVGKNSIGDILLIEGVITDFYTLTTYIAPCFIPKTTTHLILPRLGIDTSSLTGIKLMIIPQTDPHDIEFEQTSDDILQIRQKLFSKSHIAQRKKSWRMPIKKKIQELSKNQSIIAARRYKVAQTPLQKLHGNETSESDIHLHYFNVNSQQDESQFCVVNPKESNDK